MDLNGYRGSRSTRLQVCFRVCRHTPMETAVITKYASRVLKSWEVLQVKKQARLIRTRPVCALRTPKHQTLLAV